MYYNTNNLSNLKCAWTTVLTDSLWILYHIVELASKSRKSLLYIKLNLMQKMNVLVNFMLRHLNKQSCVRMDLGLCVCVCKMKNDIQIPNPGWYQTQADPNRTKLGLFRQMFPIRNGKERAGAIDAEKLSLSLKSHF